VTTRSEVTIRGWLDKADIGGLATRDAGAVSVTFHSDMTACVSIEARNEWEAGPEHEEGETVDGSEIRVTASFDLSAKDVEFLARVLLTQTEAVPR
jgi:hypothetical protein